MNARPQSLARALLQLLADAPINARAAQPVSLWLEDVNDREEKRRDYLRQRAVVETIASRGIDDLTPVTRRMAIESLRALAKVDPEALARLAAEIDAAEDRILAELDAAVAGLRGRLKPWERERRAPERRNIAPTEYGPPPVAVRVVMESAPLVEYEPANDEQWSDDSAWGDAAE